MNFSEEMAIRVSEAEKIIFSYLPKQEGFQKTVLEAMAYSVEAGGKRLRPIMMREMFHIMGGEGSVVEPFMAAIEMIHTYSLVHDDLPCMDNDKLRRGKPTTWAVYGDGMAVLTGDALLNYAFETATSAFDTWGLSQDEYMRIPEALKVLAKKAGVYGMIGGQVADVEAEKKGLEVDQDRLLFIHDKKTGALLESSLMVGAILGGADREQIEVVSKAALNIGLAFQIQDDILDIEGDEATLGKPIGSDERNGKATYVSLFGMETAKEDVRRLSDEASELIRQLNPTAESDFMIALIDSLVGRSY